MFSNNMKSINVLCGVLLAVALLHGITAQQCKCVNGKNGRDGHDGSPGKDGKDAVSKGAGAKGPQGPPGANGINGVSGVAGSQGPQGPRGAGGAKGSNGDPGRDGRSGGLDKSEIERMIHDSIRGSSGSKPDSGGGVPGSLKRVTVCSTLSKHVCGDCKCRDKNYADEFFSRGHYCDCQNVKPERDCRKHKDNGNEVDGIYLINPGDTHPFPAYCDQSTENGGWVVFQRRIDDIVDFQRDWFSYKNGFGNLQHEFWLGNENLFLIQLYDDRRGTEMRIDYKDKDGNGYSEKYGVFELGDESTKYKVYFSGYSGNAGNWMKDHNNKMFCTYDSDNDAWGGNSAYSYGAFWHGYAPSYPYHPNKPYTYTTVSTSGNKQPQTKAFQGKAHNAVKWITHIEMKVRRK